MFNGKAPKSAILGAGNDESAANRIVERLTLCRFLYTMRKKNHHSGKKKRAQPCALPCELNC